MKGWKALNNYVIMDMIDPQAHMSGELVIPGAHKKTARWGKVLSVGPGVVDYNGEFLTPDVQEGDVVYAAAHGHVKVETYAEKEWHDLTMASVMDLLCIYEEGEIVQPLGSYVYIEPLEMAKTTESGLVLPDSDKRLPSTGRVVRVGKGFQTAVGVKIPFQVKEGDIVAYDPLSTLIVDLNHLGIDKKLELVSHANLVAVLDKEEIEG